MWPLSFIVRNAVALREHNTDSEKEQKILKERCCGSVLCGTELLSTSNSYFGLKGERFVAF